MTDPRAERENIDQDMVDLLQLEIESLLQVRLGEAITPEFQAALTWMLKIKLGLETDE